MRSAFAVRWSDRLEAFLVPGIALHHALCALSLEEAAVHGLEAGMDQVIVLGHGSDSAARLAERYPEARFLEINHLPRHSKSPKAGASPDTGNLRTHWLDFNSVGILAAFRHQWSERLAKAFSLAGGLLGPAR